MAAARCRQEFLNISAYDTYVFEAEKLYAELYVDTVTDLLADYWAVSALLGLVYVITLLSLHSYMKSRPPYDLRRPLAVWSASIALFSVVGALRTVQELFFVLQQHGYRMSVCNPSNMLGPTALWAFLMLLSKAVELGDTIFIILRKRPVIFLHFYHHLSVLVASSVIVTDLSAPFRWYSSMNLSIHALMYTFYTLRACRVYVPIFVKVFITSIQILQMVKGISAALMVVYYKRAGYACHMSDRSAVVAVFFYFSYLVLFANFFHKTYLRPRNQKPNVNGKKKEN